MNIKFLTYLNSEKIMALQDVNWGSVIIGAAAITALVASSAEVATIIGGSKALTAIGSAIAGGVVGHWASKFAERMQDATVALVHR